MKKRWWVGRLVGVGLGSLLWVVGGARDAAAAEPLRFRSVTPRDAQWEILLEGEGIGAKAADLAFWLGDQPLELVATAVSADQVRLVLPHPTGAGAVPAGTLRAGLRGRKGATPQVAVALAPDPSPFANQVVYHIMMGYFRNGNPANDDRVEGWRHPNWAGGDLQGVLEKVDYLADLGVSAVWLSPIFRARTSHGYDVQNYFAFGHQYAVPDDAAASSRLFDELVAKLHARGIQVILDLPLNHAHKSYDREAGDPRGFRPRQGPARQDAEKLWESWGSGFGYWNFDDPSTRKFLIEVALDYLGPRGVDGLRLDYVRGVPHDFWAELYSAAKTRKPEAFLLGECWLDQEGVEANAEDIATYYQPVAAGDQLRPQFDSLVDFPMQILATDVFARGGSLRQLEAWLQKSPVLYGDSAQPAFFLDNHDLSRFLAWTDDPRRLVAAVQFLASLSDPLIVFYGTEAGLAHASPKPGFSDAGRIAFPWDKLDPTLHGQVRAILHARRNSPALGHGARLPLWVEDDLLVMAKYHGHEVALVAVNLSPKTRELDLDLGTLWSAEGAESIVGPLPQLTAGRLRWSLPPISTTIARQPLLRRD